MSEMENIQQRPLLLKILKSPYLIISAMIGGILMGVYAPDASTIIAPAGTIYLNLLKMTIFPILISAIITSIGHVFGNKETKIFLGRILTYSFLFLFIISIISVIFPLIIQPGSGLSESARITLGKTLSAADQSGSSASYFQEKQGFVSFLGQMIPQNIFDSMGKGHSLQILFFSILLGVATGALRDNNRKTLLGWTEALFKAFFSIIEWIMYLLPFGLFSLMAGQIAKSGLETIFAMGMFVMVIYLVSLVIFLASAVIISISTKVSFYKAIFSLKDALLIAFGTQSTFASMPATINGLSKELKVDEELVNLVVPLGSVINRFSMIITYGVATVFAAQLYGVSLGVADICLALVLIVLAAIAGAGTPGIVSLAMISIIFTPLGLPSSALLVLLLAINPVTEPITTMTNIYAVAASTALIAKKKKEPLVEEVE
ncbi:MAG: dicarboxylate/amino acid:cation symporter [Spirochaetaceae bacterium]|nr:dicarboxylate/amino acid:cation symporter [Spirochaetaceae bacterium]